MKVNELMIGNWVYNKHHGKNIRLTPYDFFTHTHNEFGEQKLAPFAKPTIGMDLEPIPLVPEILEKNGWCYDKSAFTWVNDDIGIHLEDGFDGNGFWWKAGVNHITPINYIHQLQHALRLCGIEKEIKLEE